MLQVESQAAPTKHRQQPSVPPLPGVYEQPRAPEDTFAEQFKYRICSSGLLEKDYVPGLSGVSGTDAGPIKLDWPGEMRKWMGKGKEIWDFPAAGACLLVGLVMGLGVVKSAGLLLVLALVVGSYVWYHGTPTSVSYSCTGQVLRDWLNAFHSHHLFPQTSQKPQKIKPSHH